MNIVQESIMRLQRKQAKAHREDIAKKLAYYDFDQEYLNEQIDQWINRQEKDIPFSAQNLTEKVIVRKSTVYKKAPRRVLDNDELYNELTLDKNESLKDIERMTNLLGRLAVLVHYDEELKKFEYKIITFFAIEQKFGNVVEIVYEIESNLQKKKLYAVWTMEEHFIADEFGKAIENQEDYGGNEESINPYGELPFIFPYRKKPQSGFWVEGATDVIEANEKLNLSLTLLNYLERYASFKQAYVTGPGGLEKQELSAGYNKILTLDGEGTIGVLDITAPLDKLIESLKFKIELALHLQNLSSRFGGRGQATSGFQLIVENIDLLDMWGDQVEIWRKHERDLYEKEKVVYSTITGKNLSESMHVDFAEIRFPVTQEEQRTQDDWNLLHNQTSELDIAKRESPDTPEDELKKKLEENAALNLELKPAPQPVGLEERLKGIAP